MSLIPVEGVLQTVAKAEAVDAESTSLLCQMTLFDIMGELCDIARPTFESDMDAFIAKRSEEARRGLVKTYMERRLAGEDVEDVIKAASEVTLLEVSKGLFRADDPKTPKYDGRDMMGRFASAAAGDMGSAGRTLAQIEGGGYVDPIRAERYKALKDTGTAMSALNNPTARAVGAMATAAGGLGPEAERVLGRGLKRTAYRYRGTERTANANVVGQVKNARALIDAQIAADSGDPQAEANLATLYAGFTRTKSQTFDGQRRAQPNQEPFMVVARHWGGKAGRGMTEDQARLAVQGDIGAEYLRHKLPTPRQTAISMAAGRTPPSVGLLIDRDGDVVSEAQGFNGDHFLPFDLKNLKRMQGGQYVRTRAMGGPTVEDVYTGLMTGARQMQVVSNSGVFTIEFDPTIRGGRRYSDKATQMIRRYEALLGTIGSGELMQQDVDPAKQRELRQAAIDEARGNSGRAREIFDELLEQERGKQTFAQGDDVDLEAQAIAQAREELGAGAGRSQIADLAQDKFKFLRQEQKADRVKQFRLDADGYAAAMRSLQEEFPFYIRDVRIETIPEFVRSRGLGDPESADVPVHSNATDGGHIERGETNIQPKQKKLDGTPTFAAREGLGRGLHSSDPRSGVGRQAKPVTEGEGAEGITAPGAAKPTAGRVDVAQPSKTDWKVKYDVVRETRPLADLADFRQPENRNAIAEGLIAAQSFMTDIGAEASSADVANGQVEIGAALKGKPFDFVSWLGHRGGVQTLVGLTDAHRSEAIRLLRELPTAPVKSSSVPLPADQEKLKAGLQPMLDVLEKAEPFGPRFSLEKAVAGFDKKAKPFAFPEIVAAGNKIDNYNMLASAAKRTKLGDYLDKDNLRTHITTLESDLIEAEAKRPVPGRTGHKAEPDTIREELEAAHFALSFQHARKLAESLAPAATMAQAPAGSLPFGPQAQQGVPGVVSMRDSSQEVRFSAEQIKEMFRAGPLESAVSKALTAIQSGG